MNHPAKPSAYNMRRRREDIARDIREQVGKNAPCESELRRYFGLSRDATRALLKGVPVFQMVDGGKKLYLAIDIARMISDKEMHP